jgi:hypothetical protein
MGCGNGEHMFSVTELETDRWDLAPFERFDQRPFRDARQYTWQSTSQARFGESDERALLLLVGDDFYLFEPERILGPRLEASVVSIDKETGIGEADKAATIRIPLGLRVAVGDEWPVPAVRNGTGGRGRGNIVAGIWRGHYY